MKHLRKAFTHAFPSTKSKDLGGAAQESFLLGSTYHGLGFKGLQLMGLGV